MQILVILLSSGALGFVSYYILKELDILRLPLREKEIEKVAWILFSVFNVTATYIIYSVIFKEDLFIVKITTSVLLKVIIVSLGTGIILMPFLYFFIIKSFRKIIEKIQVYYNVINTRYTPLLEEAFLNREFDEAYIIIFNFENQFIHSGDLNRMEYAEGKLNFSLYASPHYREYDYEEVIKMLHHEDRPYQEMNIVIDTDRQLKYFFFYYKDTQDCESAEESIISSAQGASEK